MTIRTFQPGDETAQAGIYNEAAAALPRFKAATLDDLQRRTRAADFDPGTRFFAEVDGQLVGYATFSANGRVSYPWCRMGHEHWAEPLFERLLETMRRRGASLAFAAYRSDWPSIGAFFTAHGFAKAREMVNFSLDLADLAHARSENALSSLKTQDIATLFKMAPHALRVSDAAGLEQHFFRNPYFGSDAAFVLRGRPDGEPTACGVLVRNAAYADPTQVDASMPCFRLGAVGSEGMQTKRINGLFSFLTRDEEGVDAAAEGLLNHAAACLRDSGARTLAAQVPSDAPHLLRFYERRFRRQGSFPVYECHLK